MTTSKDLQRRIEELEKQVRELQARPVYIPVYTPPVLPQPYYPQPWQPYPWYQLPTVTCGGTS